MKVLIEELKVLLLMGVECLDKLSKMMDTPAQEIPQTYVVVNEIKPGNKPHGKAYKKNYTLILNALRENASEEPITLAALYVHLRARGCTLKRSSVYGYLDAMMENGHISVAYSSATKCRVYKAL